MDAQELALKAVEASGKQIEKVFEGLAEADYDKRLCESAMTPRETLEHFGECYHNAARLADGLQPKWGSYCVEDKSTDNLWRVFRETRQAAIAKLPGLDDAKLMEIGMGFMALHDAYHVGQLCQLRLHLQPNWNAYAIYD